MAAPEFPMPKTPGGLDMSDASTIRTLLTRLDASVNGRLIPTTDGEAVKVEELRICLWELFEVAPRLSLRQWQKVKAAFDRVLL
jgi:hypothetical protein